MSARRRQSTKELGAILNEAVPRVVADEVQLPADEAVTPAETAQEAAEARNRADTGEEADEATIEPLRAAESPQTAADDASPPSETPAQASDATTAAATPEPEASAPEAVATAPHEPRPGPDDPQTALPAASIPQAELTFVQQEAVQEPGPDEPAEEAPVEPITWRKSTIPFRTDQYDEIGRLLAEFRAQHGVQLTIAEFVRLGLDKQIAAFCDEERRPQLLRELHEQQLRESQGNEKLKHSRSHGLAQYLQRLASPRA